MAKFSHILVLTTLLSLAGRNAHAFLDPPYITPEYPTRGDVISINVYGGICDAIVGLDGWPHVTQQGSTIHVLFWSVHYTDPILCNLGVGTATYPIGTYPVGSYVVQVDRQYFGAAGETLTETLGAMPVVVTGNTMPAVALPSMDFMGLVALGSTILACALTRLRGAVRRRF